MKLRNKKTDEINIIKVDEDYFKIYKDDGEFVCPVTLKELINGWEDYYEEPKKHYEILAMGAVLEREDAEDEIFRNQEQREIGNYFETKEEAELAVRKLKAWKRLKDKGFKFTGFTHKDRGRLDELEIYCYLGECPEDIEDMEDVRLLFGGEE